MKFIAAFFLTLLLAYVAELYSNILPWYGIAFAAALVGLAVPARAFSAWLAGFAAVFIVWFALAWMQSDGNRGVLASKMSQVLPLNGNVLLLLIATAFVGGLVGGFSALAGHYMRPVKRS